MINLNNQKVAVFNPLSVEHQIPTIITPVNQEIDLQSLISWIETHRKELHQGLISAGSFLFRGFRINSPEQFEAFCQAFSPQLLNYVGGGSPRNIVSGKVYTSTVYPQQQHIMLHNECSYLRQMPSIIFFNCQVPPSDRGQTPIGDMGKVLEKIAPEIKKKFAEKAVLYVSNLHSGKGFGRSWQDTFETNDYSVVNQILETDGYDYTWNSDGSLRISIVCPGIRQHPVTGKNYWGNQAINWHNSEFETHQRQILLSLYGEDNLPKNAYYGDGSKISDSEISHIREVLLSEEVVFNWQEGDILICDNHSIAHGRQAFSGNRRILVAMS